MGLVCRNSDESHVFPISRQGAIGHSRNPSSIRTVQTVPTFLQCSAAIALNAQEILITGGGSPPKKDARLYLTMKNEITNKAPMNESRNAHAITICKGNVYVLGGFSGKQRLCSVEKYQVREDKWT